MRYNPPLASIKASAPSRRVAAMNLARRSWAARNLDRAFTESKKAIALRNEFEGFFAKGLVHFSASRIPAEP
jgi:hypothetical protein